MNARLIFKIIGLILLIAAAFMIFPLVVAFISGEEEWKDFLITIAGCVPAGLALYLPKTRKKTFHATDGFVAVALVWIVLSAVSALPFFLSGYIPNYLDAFFEAASGLTTTGCTIVDDIEIFPNSLLFWRALTQWIGGMGILVFMLSISQVVAGGGAIFLLRAESPGPTTEKISPKISVTARYLYLIYIGLTGAEIIALIISGLSAFKSIMISFCTMATGGFSYMNSSLAALTSAQQNIVTVFMLLAGINFSLYFLVLTGKALRAVKNEELWWYLSIVAGSIALLSVSTYTGGNFSSVGEAIRTSAFTTASVITTTGFSITNVDAFPWFSKALIMLIMFIGGCAGSTAGGLKVSRISLILKSIRNSLRKLTHPRAVYNTRYNGKDQSENLIRSVFFYVNLFMVIFVISVLIVSADQECDLVTAFSAVNTTINNNGVALGGANGSLSGFAWYSKVVFIIDMLIGRLEIFPIMVLFSTMFTPVTKLFRAVRPKARS